MPKNKQPLAVRVGSSDGKQIDIFFSFPIQRIGFSVEQTLDLCKQMIMLAHTIDPQKVKNYGLQG